MNYLLCILMVILINNHIWLYCTCNINSLSNHCIYIAYSNFFLHFAILVAIYLQHCNFIGCKTQLQQFAKIYNHLQPILNFATDLQQVVNVLQAIYNQIATDLQPICNQFTTNLQVVKKFRDTWYFIALNRHYFNNATSNVCVYIFINDITIAIIW